MMVHRGASRVCALERLVHAERGAVLVVTAHPDDETVGLGATMGKLAMAGWDVQVLTVTDGAPHNASLRPTLSTLGREQAAERRRVELVEALRVGGLEPEIAKQLSFNVPDQEATLHMVEIARSLFKRLSQSPVDVLLTHPYEGGHPDHDAVASAAPAAIRMQAALSPNAPRTALAEMASCHAAGATLDVGEFLEAQSGSCYRRCAGRLVEADCRRRGAMFDAFTSQRDVLVVFDRSREPLRCAPPYDFSQPPHAGPLYYEQLPFEWSGRRWRELAQQALRVLTQC